MFGCVQTFWTRCHNNGSVVTLARLYHRDPGSYEERLAASPRTASPYLVPLV